MVGVEAELVDELVSAFRASGNQDAAFDGLAGPRAR